MEKIIWMILPIAIGSPLKQYYKQDEKNIKISTQALRGIFFNHYFFRDSIQMGACAFYTINGYSLF